MTGQDTPDSAAAPPASPTFRLAYVPGVTPTKWMRIWQERLPNVPLRLHQVPADEAPDLLRAGGADAGFARLPMDRTDLSVIPLYTETTVVVVPKDHLLTAVDEVSPEDLADEIVLHPLDDPLPWEEPPGRPANERPATTEDAIQLVAAGVGVLVVPQSLARLHHRRDLTYRPLTDAPESRVGLCWREDGTTELVEEFIGIVRGRTVNSSRGRPTPAQAPKAKAKPKPAARQGGNQRGGSGAGKPHRSGKPTKASKSNKSGKSSKSSKHGKPRRRS